MEDRMLSDEILLGIINSKSGGGGGGGTDDYNALKNQPQIGGKTLIGNKSAADLGLVAEETGKGLSTNDYTDADKAIVSGVTAALAGKQGTLTAGDYINLNNGDISVNRNLVVDNYLYTIGTNDAYYITVTKSQGGEIISTNTYSYSRGTVTNVDGNFTITHDYDPRLGYVWVYTSIKDSVEHTAGYTWTKAVTDTFSETESFPSEDVSGYKLVIKSEMDAALSGKQDILTFDDEPTDGSNNPVKSNGIYDALALKQDATDNSLETEAKTIVGAINEHEGDIGSLKSGFTDLDNEVNGDATVYPYADVITIEDAVPANLADCSVEIEPVQDLHGYDKPWVGGAGKNSFVSAVTKTEILNGITISTNGDGIYTIKGTASAQTNIDFPLKQGFVIPSSEAHNFFLKNTFNSNNVSLFFYNNDTQIDTWNCTPADRTAYTWTSMTGNTINKLQIRVQEGAIVDGTVAPMFLLKSETDTSYAPWDNICPISGHTEASVQRDGKNLVDPSTIIDGYYENEEWVIGVPGSTVFRGFKTWVKAGTYTVSFGKSVNIIRAIYDDVTHQNVATNTTSYSFTCTADGYVGMSWRDTTSGSTDWDDSTPVQLELGQTATSYEPYAGKTYTIALGDTIYGGTVDFDSGVMTVTHGIVEYEGDAGENWQKDLVSNRHSMSISKPSGSTSDTTGICNQFIYVATGAPEGCFYFGQNLNFILSEETEVSDWKTYLASNPLQVCYELATPTTIQLTPQQIQLLKGTNTLTASTGQISVTVNGVAGAIGAVQEQVNDLTDCIGWGERWNLYTGNDTKNLDGTAGRIIPNNYDNPLPKDTYTVSFNLAETPASSSTVQFVAWDVNNNVVINTTKSLAKGHNFITAEANDDIAKLTLNTNNSNSGTYSEIMIIRGDDTEHIYQPYHPVIGTAVEELLEKVPDAPTTDGTYSLQVTVASGVPTYSWVSGS